MTVLKCASHVLRKVEQLTVHCRQPIRFDTDVRINSLIRFLGIHTQLTVVRRPSTVDKILISTTRLQLLNGVAYSDDTLS